uniref:Calcium-binding and coiled-coil domain-containing protein 2 n=1 Tax=Cebus imitator TaxID=2715852 RepID=A0A2K5PPK7_CEBIM
MEKTVEDPPTSAVLLYHCHFSQVIFNSVETFYIPGRDVTCHYAFTQHFIPHLKDWIGIFRLGWKTTPKQQEVQFKAYCLPKDDEYYQFCYVGQDDVVQGASISFQFHPENEEDILVVTTQGEVEEIEQHNKDCVSLQKQNSHMQTELQKKQEELETLQSINKKWELKVKEQEDCWETELRQLKEQNQKMSSENEKMEIRVDQLQAQLSNREKEMEKLVQGDQDKTEQLEHLLTEQRKDQKKLERPLEEMKQNETTAMKKQQELTDENFHLSRRLSENRIICNVLLEGENDLLKRENSRLLSYMGLDFNSLPYQVSISDEGGTGQNPGLVYGNPYSDIQESSSPSLLSIKKCPICKDDICDYTLEQQQMQSLCSNCPICGKIFPIFEDHVFCHSL